MIHKPSKEDATATEWIKSSYSTPDGPDCVEVAAVSDRIFVRDSKTPRGPRLALTPAAWSSFLPHASGR
ncbi:DUF397 domain-containing protein [Streptomyces prasinus]|uniref:DUF397 domain-containing protein n=1 Tax=Streptomyces prasinus TaxID=67345 RepID=UPI0036296956